MVTTGSKFYLGAAFVAVVAAFAYSWGNGGGLGGALSLGLKGGTGELAGYLVLLSVAGVLAGLGVATSLLRDADPETAAAAARLESIPDAVPPAGASYWPAVGAAAAVTAAVGLVASPVLFVVGLIATGLVVLEWMVQSWSDRATGDHEVNRRIRNRLMYPIEVPVAGGLAILVLVVSVSRVLLSTSATVSWIIAAVLAVLIFGVITIFAYRPSISKDAMAVVVVLFAALSIGAGIAAAAAGSRSFEEHGEEHGGEHPAELEPAATGSEG